MTDSVPQDDHAPPGVRSWQLWFSLAAGVVTWVIHLFIVYPLTSLTCEWGWFEDTAGGLTGLQAVQIAVTVIAAVITTLAAIFALQNRRRIGIDEDRNFARHRFMANLGLGLSMLFTALIVVSLVPVLTLPQCG